MGPKCHSNKNKNNNYNNNTNSMNLRKLLFRNAKLTASQSYAVYNFWALKSTVHVFWNYSSIISQLAAAV